MKLPNELVFALERVGGGVYKRIDENRELLELLQKKYPQVLSEAPWVRNWLNSNDEFLMALAEVPGVASLKPLFKTRQGFPRSVCPKCFGSSVAPTRQGMSELLYKCTSCGELH